MAKLPERPPVFSDLNGQPHDGKLAILRKDVELCTYQH